MTLPGLDFTRKEMTILGSRASRRLLPREPRPASPAAPSAIREIATPLRARRGARRLRPARRRPDGAAQGRLRHGGRLTARRPGRHRMKLVTFTEGSPTLRLGALDGRRRRRPRRQAFAGSDARPDPRRAGRRSPRLRGGAGRRPRGGRSPRSGCRRRSRPGKVLCSGINYKGHAEENPNAKMPSEPFFFAKLPSSVVGPTCRSPSAAADRRRWTTRSSSPR